MIDGAETADPLSRGAASRQRCAGERCSGMSDGRNSRRLIPVTGQPAALAGASSCAPCSRFGHDGPLRNEFFDKWLRVHPRFRGMAAVAKCGRSWPIATDRGPNRDLDRDQWRGAALDGRLRLVWFNSRVAEVDFDVEIRERPVAADPRGARRDMECRAGMGTRRIRCGRRRV